MQSHSPVGMRRMENVLLAPLVLLAAPPVLHVGFHDPEHEGWQMTSSDAGVFAGPGTEATGSGVHHYWRLYDGSTAGGSVYHVEPPTDAFAGDWRLAVSARVVDSPVVPGFPDVPGTGLIVRDGQNYWSFYLANAWVGPMGSASSLAQKYWMDTRDDYHCYVIERSPGDDTADFYVDGQLVFANVSRAGLYEAPDQLVSFGPVSTEGTSDVHYEYVRFRWEGKGDLGGPDEPRCLGNSAQHESPASGTDSVFAGSPPSIARSSPDALVVAGVITEVPGGCSVSASPFGARAGGFGLLLLASVVACARRRP